MRFFNPWAFAGLATIPMIIAMYLLKQKHQEVKVSSLFLWQQTLIQSQVQKPWQKLRKNLLLLLQIIGAVLFIMALGDPYLLGRGLKAQNYIFVLDQSMSMQAVDEQPNRFEAAKKKLEELVQGMEPGSRASIIVMGKQPYILVNQSEDKTQLSKKIRDLKVTNTIADLDSTKSLINALREQTKGNIYVFSDQYYSFGEIPMQTVLFGKSSDNVGIALISHGVEQEQILALVKVKNNGTSVVSQEVSLYADGNIHDVKEITISPNQEVSVFFSGIEKNTQLLMAQLSSKDILTVDDIAYDVINPKDIRRIALVTEQNVFLDKIFAALPDVELYKVKVEDMEKLKGYQVYVFDGVLPTKLPTDGHILAFNPPVESIWVERGEDQEVTQITVGEGNFLKFIKELDFAISKSRILKKNPDMDVILSSEHSPLIMAGEKNGQKILLCGFDLHQTDLPLKKEFPIFIYNSIQWLLPEKVYNLDKITSGDTVEFNTAPEADQVRIISPGGELFVLAPPFPVQPFDQTHEVGFFTLEQKGKDFSSYHSFSVNPAVEGESDLKREEVRGEQSMAQGEYLQANRNLKFLFLGLLLLLLLVEWWVYSRAL